MTILVRFCPSAGRFVLDRRQPVVVLTRTNATVTFGARHPPPFHSSVVSPIDATPFQNSFVCDVFERIATEAGRLTKFNKRATLTSREMQTAVRLVLPGMFCSVVVGGVGVLRMRFE